jgi:murein DD-endopeptidase MepM/ murein hydrolase activator NlpD
MSDAQAQIDAITRSIGNLDSKLNSVIPKLNSVINPTGGGGTGGSNALSKALGSFSNTGSGAVGQILGGIGQVATAGVTYGMMAMPDVQATTSRSAAFYRSALTTPGTSRNGIAQATFNAMKGGISSPGGDAQVANYLTSRGVAFSNDPNSTYMQMTRNIGNSAKYLGMDNMSSAMAIENLTSGQTSANLMTSLGIYTSDPMTGKSRSESQIFGDIAGVLTAGQGKMSAQDVMDSYRKGNLGASLNNMGLSQDQQQRFVQFMVNKTGGQGMDLSNNAEAKALMGKNNKLGNSNPIQSTLDINTTMTDQMQAASGGYEKGMADAAGLFQQMNGHVKDLIANFGVLNAQVQTYTATPVGAAQLTAGAQIASGAAQITSGIVGIFTGGPANGNALGTTTNPGNKSSMSATHAPANGPITAHLGQQGPMWSAGGHNGTDYAVPDGSPIYAAADGKVSIDTVGAGARSYGHYITVDHGNGYQTRYAHLDPSSADVHPGDEVKAGQVIGRSGHSGHVTGPHLHFEVLKDGTSVPIEGFLSGAVAVDPPKGKSKTTTTSGGASTSGLDNLFEVSLSGFSAVMQSAATLLGAAAPSTAKAVASWTGASAAGTASSPAGASTEVTAKGGPANGNSMGMMSSSPMIGGGSSGNKVEINLHIAQASEAEARKFATIVKQMLDQDKLTANMGSF